MRELRNVVVGFCVGEGVGSGDVVGRSFDGRRLGFLEEQLAEIVHILPDGLLGGRLFVAGPEDGGLVGDWGRGGYGVGLRNAEGIFASGTLDALAGVVGGKADFLGAGGTTKLDKRGFLRRRCGRGRYEQGAVALRTFGFFAGALVRDF